MANFDDNSDCSDGLTVLYNEKSHVIPHFNQIGTLFPADGTFNGDRLRDIAGEPGQTGIEQPVSAIDGSSRGSFL